MKILGRVLFVACFAVLMIWKIHPQWLGLGRTGQVTWRFDPAKLRRLAPTCDAYSAAIEGHVERLAAADTLEAVVAVERADHDALARIIPPASIAAAHDRWIAAEERLAAAAEAVLASDTADTRAALADAASASQDAIVAIADDCG